MPIDDKIRTAFDGVHAGESLKASASDFVYRKTGAYHRSFSARRAAAALACIAVLLVGAGGYFSYTVPVAAISMDVDSSVELSVNIYEKVICVTAYNENGERLAEDLQVKHMNYADAIDAVLQSETVCRSLSEPDAMEITIAGASEKIKEKMQTCIAAGANADCAKIYCNDGSVIEQAHSVGLSCGKYRAFLELQALEPQIDVQQVRAMSMKELRSRIAAADNADYANDGKDDEAFCGGENCSGNENCSGGNGQPGGESGNGHHGKNKNENDIGCG